MTSKSSSSSSSASVATFADDGDLFEADLSVVSVVLVTLVSAAGGSATCVPAVEVDGRGEVEPTAGDVDQEWCLGIAPFLLVNGLSGTSVCCFEGDVDLGSCAGFKADDSVGISLGLDLSGSNVEPFVQPSLFFFAAG